MLRVTRVTVSLLTLSSVLVAVSPCREFNPKQCFRSCNYGYRTDGLGCATCHCKVGSLLHKRDIKLPDVIKSLLEVGSTSRNKRGIGSSKSFDLWKEYPHENTYLVPYYISYNENSKLKEAVEDAAKLFAENTCIRLVTKTHQHPNFVYVTDGSGGCSSDRGMKGGSQIMKLGDKSEEGGSCKKTFIVFHEFMHIIIGFFQGNENIMKRNDNVDPKAIRNFDVKGAVINSPRSTTGVKFAKNESPSAADYARINSVYGC